MNATTELRRVLDAGQADAAAITRAPRNLADPDVRAARINRIVAAAVRRTTRLSQMCEARATIRKTGIQTPAEFLAQLQNTLAATPDHPGSILSRYRSMLSDLAVAIEDDLQGDGE